jgi:Glycosyl transferases group 1
VRILLWHVHGSWTTSFVQGRHHYVVPVVPDRGPDGRGRARTWDWPASVVERTPAQLRDEPVDVVLLQRPEDESLARAWLGRRPGRDVAAVWLEHNTPQGRIADMRHPAADRSDIVVVHVTHTNALFWDCGTSPTRVIEQGIVDPGHRFSGELPRVAVVVNEPARRGRVVGADLVPRLADAAPVDVFGIGASAFADSFRSTRIAGHEDLPQDRMHDELARRRAYVHPNRWTSIGLSLIEAMHLGLPLVALGTTDIPHAVPTDAGVISNRVDVLGRAIRRFVADPEEAARVGKAGREYALERYGLARFLSDWDEVLEEVAS